MAKAAVIERVTSGLPADQAGLKSGDVIVECDNVPIVAPQAMTDAIYGRDPGQIIKLMAKRDGKLEEFHVKLGAAPASDTETPPGGQRFGREQIRPTPLFHKPVYRLALIGVEFADVKHNPQIKQEDWEQSMFSIGSYNKSNATGQTVYGSVNDYYHEEIPPGNFAWTDRCSIGSRQTRNARNTLTAPETTPGCFPKFSTSCWRVKGTMRHPSRFDGVAFIYAGDRLGTTRGGLFWPHKATLNYNRRRIDYLIVPEGGTRMTNISVFCHEFGHMLGLPDVCGPKIREARDWVSEVPDVSQLPNGKPQHMSAWCKERNSDG